MGIPVGARILMRYENSKGVRDIQHLIGIPIIVPKSHWGSGEGPVMSLCYPTGQRTDTSICTLNSAAVAIAVYIGNSC